MSEKNIEEKIDLSLLRDFEENGIQAIKDFLKNHPGELSAIVLASKTIKNPKDIKWPKGIVLSSSSLLKTFKQI